jgi:hypothetical protein
VLQRGRGPLGVPVQCGGGALGLHHHDRHAVRHHVVQLPGDPGSLGRDGERRPLPLLAGQISGALLERGQVRAPAAHRVADRDRRDQQQPHLHHRLTGVEQAVGREHRSLLEHLPDPVLRRLRAGLLFFKLLLLDSLAGLDELLLLDVEPATQHRRERHQHHHRQRGERPPAMTGDCGHRVEHQRKCQVEQLELGLQDQVAESACRGQHQAGRGQLLPDQQAPDDEYGEDPPSLAGREARPVQVGRRVARLPRADQPFYQPRPQGQRDQDQRQSGVGQQVAA